MTGVLILVSPVMVGAVFSLDRYLSARWWTCHRFVLSHRSLIPGWFRSILGGVVVVIVDDLRIALWDGGVVLQGRSGIKRWS